MARPATVYWDKRKQAWATSALGEKKTGADGKPYRTKVYNREIPKSDRAGAWAWLAAELKAREGAKPTAGSATCEQVVEWYLQDLEPTVTAETFARRDEHLDRFLMWPAEDDPQRMEIRDVRRVTRDDVTRFLRHCLENPMPWKKKDSAEVKRERPNSESYISDGLLKSLKACFNWAASVEPGRFSGLPLAKNPLAGMRGPSVKRRQTRDVDPAAVDRFMAWCWERAEKMTGLPQRFAKISTILLMCLRDSGPRPKELCSATWEEWLVRPDGWGVIMLAAHRHKTGKKTGKARVIALPPRCAELIEWIRLLPGRHPTHIFTHRRGRGQAQEGEGSPWAGEPWVKDPEKDNTKSLQKWFNRLLGEAKKDAVKNSYAPLPDGFRLYWLRSAYSTEAQRRGVPRALLAEAMGTSERMLEKNYTDLVDEDVVNVAKEVARRIEPGKNETPSSAHPQKGDSSE